MGKYKNRKAGLLVSEEGEIQRLPLFIGKKEDASKLIENARKNILLGRIEKISTELKKVIEQYQRISKDENERTRKRKRDPMDVILPKHVDKEMEKTLLEMPKKLSRYIDQGMEKTLLEMPKKLSMVNGTLKMYEISTLDYAPCAIGYYTNIIHPTAKKPKLNPIKK